MSERARQLFDSLRSDWAAIQRCVADRKPELYMLDYKSVGIFKGISGTYPSVSVAAALASLANAEGGVVIYGVETEKNADGQDVPKGPIEGPSGEVTIEKLGAWASSYITPTIPGLQIELAKSPDGLGQVVLCLVPESPLAPHMALAPDRRQGAYYMRVSDGKVAMGHAHVELAFRRRLTHELTLAPVLCIDEDKHAILNPGNCDFWAINAGRSAAVNLAAHLLMGPNRTQIAVRGLLPVGPHWHIHASASEQPQWLISLYSDRTRFMQTVAGNPVSLVLQYDDTSGISYETAIQLVPRSESHVEFRGKGGRFSFRRVSTRY